MAGRENSCQQCLWAHQNPGEGRGGQLTQRAGCELESQVLQERRNGPGDQWQKAQDMARQTHAHGLGCWASGWHDFLVQGSAAPLVRGCCVCGATLAHPVGRKAPKALGHCLGSPPSAIPTPSSTVHLSPLFSRSWAAHLHRIQASPSIWPRDPAFSSCPPS